MKTDEDVQYGWDSYQIRIKKFKWKSIQMSRSSI